MGKSKRRVTRHGRVRRLLCCICTWWCLGLFVAAQAKPATPPKEVHFEVLSLHPMNSSVQRNTQAPSPDGFDSQMSLWQMIMVAYGPSNMVNWGSVEVLNTPKWIGEFYEIKGRVAPADLNAWQSQSSDHELLRAAMRAVLKERCKLVIHEQPRKAEIFELLVAKHGPRLKVSPPGETAPSGGFKVKSGGIMVQTVENGKQTKTFYGATTQDLTDFLCIMSGQTPVRDKTGLKGRYDFRIQQEPPRPDENHVYSYSVDHLGLQVKLGTEIRPALVIDHIEKPTEN